MSLVNVAPLAGVLTIFLVTVSPACAADNLSIERLATCQDSWLDWKESDPVQLKKFADSFRSDFLRKEKDSFFVPKSNQTVVGLSVAQVFPESIGMAVGFSVVVNANFDSTKTSLAKKIGKSLSKCEPPSDNMRTCELEIGEKKTILLMAEDNVKARQPFSAATTSMRNEAAQQRTGIMADRNTWRAKSADQRTRPQR
jgi:hypothetical protein